MEYEDMTVAQLKELLREADLPVSGNKSVLIERLIQNDELLESNVDDSVQEESDDFDDTFDDEDDFFDEDDWDEIHTARQKPVLDEETKANLATRAAQMKKQPKFRRQEWFRYHRLSRTGWRKPKGLQSKQRLNMKYRTPMARVGYGKISSVRGLHSSGFEDILVNNPNDLDGLDPERQAVRVSASVGNRKRAKIHDRADDLGLRVLNRRKINRKGDIE